MKTTKEVYSYMIFLHGNIVPNVYVIDYDNYYQRLNKDMAWFGI